MTDTSRSANERSDFALFCNPESRRVEGFSIALGRRLRQRPVLVPWASVLEGSEWEKQLENAPRFLRLESPGRNWAVEKQLLLVGATIIEEEHTRGWRHLSPEAVLALSNDPGRL